LKKGEKSTKREICEREMTKERGNERRRKKKKKKKEEKRKKKIEEYLLENEFTP